MKIQLDDNFIIDKLKSTDEKQLFQFIFENRERFQKFFPVTLYSNSSIEKSSEYIAIKIKEIQEKTNFTFAIREVSSQEIVGLIIIKKIDWKTKTGEFAYCIGYNSERKGLITKAVLAMSKYAFDALELNTLQIIAHKTNLSSVKVAENAGFTWKSKLLNEFTPLNETPLNMELFELTR